VIESARAAEETSVPSFQSRKKKQDGGAGSDETSLSAEGLESHDAEGGGIGRGAGGLILPPSPDQGSSVNLSETLPISKMMLESVQAARPKDRRVSLLVYHRDGAEIIPLRPAEPVPIGRDPASGVRVPDPSMSREHARFIFEGGSGNVRVEDLGSKNGTWVAGKRVERAIVRSGDEIVMGSVRAFVHIASHAGAEAETHGLHSHERFRVALEDELVRARFFSRPFGVVMVRAARHAGSHVSRWAPRVRSLLRPVDRAALYSSEAVEILLPESGSEAVMELARFVIASRGEGDAPLLVGCALFPETATDAESLLDLAWGAVQRATVESPLQSARAVGWGADAGSSKALAADAPVAESKAMKKVFAAASRVAGAALAVLLQGETGVGKEVVARAIHAGSLRGQKPIVSVNCGAIPGQLLESTLFGHMRGSFTGAYQDQKGVFEAAEGGTVLLDEIGELPAAAQAALLRVLDLKQVIRVGSTKEISVDVRVIAATHRDLEAMCETGAFRRDLFYRLNALPILIPPLRERPEEIEPLAKRFLREANRANGRSVRGIDPAALVRLKSYGWPGNVRELKNAVERAVVIAASDMITEDDLPERVLASLARSALPSSLAPPGPPAASVSPASAPTDAGSGPPKKGPKGVEAKGGGASPPLTAESFKDSVRRFEAERLIAALEETGGNQTEAARLLDIPLRTLAHKIKAYKIKRKGYGVDDP
jgi:two-component system response regulator AtoC